MSFGILMKELLCGFKPFWDFPVILALQKACVRSQVGEDPACYVAQPKQNATL